jgi:hypothetical protein
MSGDELRWWMRELDTNPVHGWAGHHAALARAIGFQDSCPGNSMLSKFRARNRAWIYPGEQLRFSRGIGKILAGEVVCRKVGKHWQAVLADHPQPLRPPVRFRYNLARGGLEWVQVGKSPGSVLPSFKTLISAAPRGHAMGK